MSQSGWALARWGGPPAVAVAVVCLVGGGTLVALAGVAGGGQAQAVSGSVVAAVGLAAVVGFGWVEGAWLVALAAPGPALVERDLRLALGAVVAGLVAGVWLLKWLAWRRPVERGALPGREAAWLLAVYTVAGMFSRYPLVAAREVLNLAVLLLLLVAVVDELTLRPGLAERVASTIAVVASGVGAAAVLEAVGVVAGAFPAAEGKLYRAALTFGQPNELGLYLALSLPFVVYAWEAERRGWKRGLWLVGLGCVVGGLVGTLSRGSWLAVVAGAGALALAGRPGRMVWIWAVAVVALLAADWGTGGAVRARLARTLGDWVVEQRLELTVAGVLMFLSHPVLGVGPGGFAEELERVGASLPGLSDYLPTPHNAFVQVAAEAGVLGLLAFVLFVVRAWWRVVGQARHSAAPGVVGGSLAGAALWSVTAGVVASLFMWPLSHGAGEAFVLALGLGLAGGARRQEAGETR